MGDTLELVPDVRFMRDGVVRSVTSVEERVIVIDFWHIRCPRCIQPLTAFTRMSAAHRDIAFVACAMNVGDGSYELTRDILRSLSEDGLFDDEGRVVHVFAEEKEPVKRAFGVETVPHCVAIERVDSGGSPRVLFRGRIDDLDVGALGGS